MDIGKERCVRVETVSALSGDGFLHYPLSAPTIAESAEKVKNEIRTYIVAGGWPLTLFLPLQKKILSRKGRGRCDGFCW